MRVTAPSVAGGWVDNVDFVKVFDEAPTPFLLLTPDLGSEVQSSCLERLVLQP